MTEMISVHRRLLWLTDWEVSDQSSMAHCVGVLVRLSWCHGGLGKLSWWKTEGKMEGQRLVGLSHWFFS